jgi:hypothetical protein
MFFTRALITLKNQTFDTQEKELYRRLRAGHLGPQLLPWLNALPETAAVLTEFFQGQPINAQNLSDWRQGGFKEWEDKQDKTHRIKELAAFASKLTAANSTSIAEGAAAIAAGKILELLEAADSADTTNIDHLRDLVSALTSLRSAELAKAKGQLDRDKLARKDEEITLAKQKFEQQLKEYQDKVAAQKAEIQSALSTARAGGITPDTLERIEAAAKLL